jgi:excisionase family DNA binding protein
MPTLLTATEVAQLLRLSEGRVYELARLAILPVVRVGRQVRFDARKLIDWIDQGGKGLADVS